MYSSYISSSKSVRATADKFNLSDTVVRRIQKQYADVLARLEKGESMNVKRPLKAKHPILEARMSDLLTFLELREWQ